MSAATAWKPRSPDGSTTLLELVRALSEVTESEEEIVATVVEMLRSGRVRLCGNFRGSGADSFSS